MDDEITRVLIVDAPIFSSAFILMLVYLCLLFSVFNCIGIRIWLSFSIIIVLIFTLAIGYGFACMIGTEMSIIAALVPFILIGVGVDDMIILVDTYDRLNHDLTATLRISGLSISLTSFCSFVAFFIASFAPNAPPSINTFCITASVSFLALYVMQFLVLVPLMIYDQNRMDSNGNFCCPCYRHKRKSVCYDETSQKRKETGCYFDAPLILNRTIVPLMKYRVCRWIIIILFLGVLGLSLYYLPSVDRETDASLMVPSDSFVIDYSSVFESSFDARLLTEVQIIIEDEDFSQSETRQNVDKFFKDLSNHQNYIFLNNWYEPFINWLLNDRQIDINNINITNNEFYDELQSFVNITEYRSWKREIIYGYNNDNDDIYIKTTRFYLRAFKDESILSQYQDYIEYNNIQKNNSLNGYMFED